MATQGVAKPMRDKEMSAVTYNMKEQRVLEKSLQTLKLEQSYALKLLELDNRIIKVQYKKLKEKVSKIKSHLPAEDIGKFRELDQKGKLKPSCGGLSVSSAIKIAAASRRLNLDSSRSTGRRSTRSGLPKISVSDLNKPRTNKPEVGNKLRRSNSVTGVFIDAPQPEKNQRPASAIITQNSNGPFPNSITFAKEDSDLLGIKEIDINHINGVLETKDSLAVPDDTAVGVTDHKVPGLALRATSAFPRSHNAFSSHTTAEKDARAGLSTAPAQYNRMRRLSHVSNDSIDSNLGENIYEERRQELLEEESVRAATLDRRTKLFLKDVDDYLQRNPPLQASHVAFETPLPEQTRTNSLEDPPDPFSNDKTRLQRRHGRIVENSDTPTFFPEVKYKERLLTLWKDMNKCRYLRLPDEKIDLSGINTLVKDQMKLFETLRQAERAPLKEAWEN